MAERYRTRPATCRPCTVVCGHKGTWPDGSTKNWTIETSGPAQMSRRGLKKTDFVAGYEFVGVRTEVFGAEPRPSDVARAGHVLVGEQRAAEQGGGAERREEAARDIRRPRVRRLGIAFDVHVSHGDGAERADRLEAAQLDQLAEDAVAA